MKKLRNWLILISVVIAGVVIYFASMPLNDSQAYYGTELSGAASDFALTDQDGKQVALSEFRGKVVVLTFMDSQCREVCPLNAAQLRQAYQRLDQSEADRVVFLAVNVNVGANTSMDIAQATQKWRLDEIPSWHFLTGNKEDLESVWKDYGVAAEPIVESGEIMHTPGVFLIDQDLQQRWYISMPPSEGSTEAVLPLSELLIGRIREILRDK